MTTAPGDIDALFVRDGDCYLPTTLTEGPWDPNFQHGGPVCALLATVAEAVPTLVPMRAGRLTVDLMRTVPVAPLHAVARVVREGKRLQVVEAMLTHDGVEVARASVLRMRIGASADALTHSLRPDEAPPRAPQGVDTSRLGAAGFRIPGFIRALDMSRVVGGLGTGAPAISWFRLKVPVVFGEESSPWARLAAMADFTSGTANFLEIDRWSSINADVTLNMLREPSSDWIAVDAVAHVAGDGIGHSRASLYDLHGLVGTGATTQIVDEVAAPFSPSAQLGEMS